VDSDRLLRLPARLDNLAAFQDFARRQAERAGLSPDRLAHAELVLEEILVNVIKYAYADVSGDIELTAVAIPGSGTLRLTIRDFGPPFDPLSAKPPQLDADVDQRPVGGLGLYLIQRLADSVTYRHDQGGNLVEVVISAAGPRGEPLPQTPPL
jgi:serine/threonine-protein kinase RsbW